MDLPDQLELLERESSDFLAPEEFSLWKRELLSKKLPAERYEKLAACMDCTPEEIPVLIQKHFPWNGRQACDCVLESQKENEELSAARLAALLVVEQENTALRQQVAELTALGVSLHKAAAAGAQAERAAVVAFLRETLATSETAHASDDLDYAIDIIERGAHRDRREEEE